MSDPRSNDDPRTPSAGAGRRPFGSIAASVIDGFRTLLRQQISLAKTELMEAIAARATGLGMIAAAGVLAAYAIGFIALALSAVLALLMPSWVAYLLVAVLMGAVAVALVSLGRRVLKDAPALEHTQATLKEDARWVQQQIAR